MMASVPKNHCLTKECKVPPPRRGDTGGVKPQGKLILSQTFSPQPSAINHQTHNRIKKIILLFDSRIDNLPLFLAKFFGVIHRAVSSVG